MSFTVNVANPRSIADVIERLKRIKEMAMLIGVEPQEWAKPYCLNVIDPQHGQTYIEGFSASTYAQKAIKEFGVTMNPDIMDTPCTTCFSIGADRYPKRGLSIMSEFFVGLGPVPHDTHVEIGKADLDAFTAAALLLQTHHNIQYYLNEYEMKVNGVDQVGRVEIIPDGNLESRVALVDQSDRGTWKRSVRQALSEQEYLAKLQADPLLPLHSYVRDFKIDPFARTINVLRWLLAGVEPAGYREKAITEKLAAATATQLIALEGNVAVVKSTHFGASGFAYLHAPVALCFNPQFQLSGGEPHLKYTLCQVESGHIDLSSCYQDLNQVDAAVVHDESGKIVAGWGGSPVAGGSPTKTWTFWSSRLTRLFMMHHETPNTRLDQNVWVCCNPAGSVVRPFLATGTRSDEAALEEPLTVNNLALKSRHN